MSYSSEPEQGVSAGRGLQELTQRFFYNAPLCLDCSACHGLILLT